MNNYDLVFRHAEVFDGSGGSAQIEDVAIQNGKIAEIGEISSRGVEEIDCSGLSLSPGFIDVHTHSDSQLLSDPSRLCKLMQGVTYEIGGQCGWSRGPAAEEIPEAGYEYLRSANNGGWPLKLYSSYHELIEAISSYPLGAHQMVFVGHHLLRASTVGMEARAPTDRELSRMKELLEKAMQEGAPGFSTGLVYAPGCYSKTEELIELAKIAARYDGIYTTHMRDEADRLPEAVEEAVRIARETGIRVNISHLKVMYRKNLPKLEQAVAIIDRACSEGCRITFDLYPYEASSATLLSTLPPSYLSHDMDWLTDELSTPEGIDRLDSAIREPTEEWENPLLNIGYDQDLIVWARNTRDAVGKTIHEYAHEKGLSDVAAYALLIRENRGAVTDIRFTMFTESLLYLYRHPLAMLGTDGLYAGGGHIAHPRAFASFPRYLGRLVREQQILPFSEAIRRITGMPADIYRLKGKGYIRPDYDADLVLFDRKSIRDQATYADPFLPNRGIEAVFVSGQSALVNNIPTGVLNGKVYTRRN